MRTFIERRERRRLKQRKRALRWTEANDGERWVALQVAKALWRARGKASTVECKFEVRFG